MMVWVKHIACPQLLCFFLFFFLPLFEQTVFGTVRSAALALIGMDVLEMRILYEEVIRDILFYFFFFPFSFCLPHVELSTVVFLHSSFTEIACQSNSVGSMWQPRTFSLDAICYFAGGIHFSAVQIWGLSQLMTTQIDTFSEKLHLFCSFHRYLIKTRDNYAMWPQ